MWTLPTEKYVELTSLIESWSYVDSTDSGLERASKAALLPIAVAIRGLVDPGGIVSDSPVYDPESLIPEGGEIGNIITEPDAGLDEPGDIGEAQPGQED